MLTALPGPGLYRCRASAGAGKTYRLVQEYLAQTLARPDAYRRLLVLTFTNDATAELRHRVVEKLAMLAQEGTAADAALQAQLCHTLGLSPQALRLRAASGLREVLHGYSYLAIVTLDSFFLRVVKACQRELQMPPLWGLALEKTHAWDYVINRLLNDLAQSTDLNQWVDAWLDYHLQKPEGGKWNLRGWLEQQLPRLVNSDRKEEATTPPADLLSQLQQAAHQRQEPFREVGRKAQQIMNHAGVTVENFAFGDSGPAGWLVKLASAEGMPVVGNRILNTLQYPEKWVSKDKQKTHPRLMDVAQEHLHPLLVKAQELADGPTGRELKLLLAVQPTAHLVPLRKRVETYLADYRQVQQVLFLEDLKQLMGQALAQTDASFLYEKMGVRYRGLYLDEFQDTDPVQWANFRPLAQEAMASGGSLWVVGDDKQNIYGWRGAISGQLDALPDSFPELGAELKHDQVLNTNFRSGGVLVQAFNDWFPAMAEVLAEDNIPMEDDALRQLLTRIYSPEGVAQLESKQNGYLQVTWQPQEKKAGEAVPHEDADEDTAADAALTGGEPSAWVQLVRRLYCEEGFALKDITVLVRSNEQVQQAVLLLQAQGIEASAPAALLHESPRVAVALSLLQWWQAPDNTLAWEHLRQWSAQMGNALPDAAELKKIGSQPLPWALMQAGSLLGLDASADAGWYTFMQAVHHWYHVAIATDHAAFQAWWGATGHATQVVGSAGGGVRVMTVHKAKGLSLPVVIMPWLDWQLEPDDRKPTFQWQTLPGALAALGPLPVPLTKKLIATDLESLRQEYASRGVLENMNVLYVALTRAAQQLYAWAELPKRMREGSKEDEKPWASTGSLLLEGALRHNRLAQNIREDGDAMVLRLGEPAAVAPGGVAPDANGDAVPLGPVQGGSMWAARGWVFRRRVDEVQRLTQGDQEQRRWGLLFHEVMAAVTEPTLRVEQLAPWVRRGWLSAQEAPAYARWMQERLNEEPLKGWLAPDWHTLPEPTVLAQGRAFRPDRVLRRGSGGSQEAVVLEFKTGQETAAHLQQLAHYMDLLRQMGLLQVQGYCIYVGGDQLKVVAA